MVAQKRGRGAKGQPAKTHAAAQSTEEQLLEQSETTEQVPETTEGNGDAAEQQELSEDALLAGDGDGDDHQAEGGAEVADATEASAETKEEKVESGKVLIENLPLSYLFDYQEKLKELFSKHGEVTAVK